MGWKKQQNEKQTAIVVVTSADQNSAGDGRPQKGTSKVGEGAAAAHRHLFLVPHSAPRFNAWVGFPSFRCSLLFVKPFLVVVHDQNGAF